MTLKELRKQKNITQEECAKVLKIPLRTYIRYENDVNKINTFKYEYILDMLSKYNLINEDHGILTLEQIKNITSEIFPKYDVNYCYLFGSYARGQAKDNSDVDLFISMPLNGLKFYELIEELREKLGKKIDLLDESQIENNPKLALEILRDGVKLYNTNIK